MRQVLLTLLLLLCAPTGLFAQTNVERESLRGLSAVPVSVQVSDGSGIASNQLQSYVELQLRKAGIRVPENNIPKKSDGFAYLSVMLISGNHEIQVLEVRLFQLVDLSRNPTMNRYAITWEGRSCGGSVASTDANIKREVSEYLDIFINDFLAVNPK